ncbi:MAG: hypothetical protein ABUS57_00115 [Pseudomonadota bacterium]
MSRIVTLLAALLALSGCVLAPSTSGRRAALADQISDDAEAFNEAYGQAVSGQILLNMMRGRDRMPRYYLSMTGIADSPSVAFHENAGIGGIPLGSSSSPWGLGDLGVSRDTESRPAYAVQPFDAGTLTRTAFEPTQSYVFAHYWESGWPHDILILLMVERIQTISADGVTHDYVNEANTIFNDCVESVVTDGCAFVREARRFAEEVSDQSRGRSFDPHGATVCGLIEAFTPAQPVHPEAPGAASQHCEPVFIVGRERVTLKLRSLDDMIYYVGELMRAGSMDEQRETIEAQVTVKAAGLKGGGAGVPLFRIVRGDRHGMHYAASIDYDGERYSAGPPVGRSCGAATPDGRCRDDAEHGDRSSSVLSLIAELMALNQSPDAIRAPDRVFTQ